MNYEAEFHQSQLDLQQMIEETLDRCQRDGAKVDDLRFLAWQTGCTKWVPAQNVIQLRRQ